MTTIYVIRHGQTDWNKEGRMQGRAGLPLNEQGLKQAERLREMLGSNTFDQVFSSPQQRAVQTAEIATGRQAAIDARLDVFDLGEADGLPKAEVKMNGVVPDSDVYAGVEEVGSFTKRVFGFMRELEKSYGGRDGNILISGHRCTTGCIGAYFEGIPDDGNILRLSLGNGEYKVYELG
ncbi:histidine phosphatase family protein [Paenibacillus ginsengarvi]|uniref:Histidine phosphatase family protein n=1 Tax=Paenibacillus ginsengarvi TaxID=400777 RepID=A0A3B0C5S6_9BACL|nr:histidine phosphatase family protein [Paenibacillus ginsengarvi]RKN80630.1 histidine phosphatase family protein [Paenibacillus ginsengarvi]